MKKLFLLIFISMLFFSNSVQASRMIPEKVEPVIYNGIKYIAPAPNAFYDETEGKMGYIEAWDIETGKKLWEKKAYEIKYNPRLEKDVQDVFITSLRVEGDKLIVMNDDNEEFKIDIAMDKTDEELVTKSYQEEWTETSADKYPEAFKKAKEVLKEWGQNPEKYEFEGKFYDYEIWVWESENYISVTFYPIGLDVTSQEVEIRMTKEDLRVLSVLKGS